MGGVLRAIRSAAAALVLTPLLLSGCGGGGGPAGGPPVGPPAPPADEVAVAEIQGAAHVSPMLGREVETEGVVTAVRGDRFHLQDPDGDGDPATSEAVLVSGDGASVGNHVRVTGTVDESVPGGDDTGNLPTTLLRASEVEVVASEEPLPAPVPLGEDGRLPPEVEVISPDELPVDLTDPDQAAAAPFEPGSEGLDFYESLEAMRVRIVDPVAVGPVERFGPGEAAIWTLVEDGDHVTPDDARTFRGGILLSTDADNRGDHNPERVRIQLESGLTPGPVPTVRVGAGLADVTGVMDYGFGNYGVYATSAVDVDDPAAQTPETTPLAGDAGHVTVATYNVLNLNPTPEASERMAELGRHIAQRLGAPDVVALQEIQDENGTEGGEDDTETDATATLRALAEAVAAAGGPDYEFADVAPEPNSSGGAPGGNIRNAFLWRPARVELVDLVSVTPQVLRRAGARDPEAFSGSRNPLAATFTFDGERFTVVNNHFSSRAGSEPVFGAGQPFEQAGEEEREAQSRAVHDYVAHLLEGNAAGGVVVAGDLNTFEFTDDLTDLLPGTGGILENLVRSVPTAERYSYNFEGNSQTLDHVFVTDGLRAGAEADVVHLNADVPEAEAASDHEPMVVRLAVP